MQMDVRVTDNRKRLDALMDTASSGGLVAAADVLVRAVKHAMAKGYTSGDFVTGRVRASVRRSEVEREPNQRKAIRVGSNVDYALYWELGHHNIFTRRYERSEKWVPTALEKQTEMANAYARTVTRIINQGMPR